jgi:glycosyltransferase involved in cell wall biosynthesis
MRILHICPTHFSDQSVIGGAERYSFELAKAMSERQDVVLVSFASQPASMKINNLRVVYLASRELVSKDHCSCSPFSVEFLRWISWADVIHCHQAHTHATNAALVLAQILRKRLFVTDLGGGGRYALSYYLPVFNLADGFLVLSEYSKDLWQKARSKLGLVHIKHFKVIYGGVDTAKFSPGTTGERSKTALFVGRLLPHKGIDYAIEAIDDGLSLDVVGRVHSMEYFNLLKEKSTGRDVTFSLSAGDDDLVEKYRRALVTITPSVYNSSLQTNTLVPELLGLAALESMSCGTPVIATNVGSLPEIVKDGETGFLVPPNDPIAIREKIKFLRENPGVVETMSKRCRDWILSRFTWDAVARSCLAAYESS